MKLPLRGLEIILFLLVGETDLVGASAQAYDNVATVITFVVMLAIPALILVSIIKMIMNHIKA